MLFFLALFWGNWWTSFSRFVSVHCVLSSHISDLICFVIMLLIARIVCIFVWWTNRLLACTHQKFNDCCCCACARVLQRARMLCHLQCKHICLSWCYWSEIQILIHTTYNIHYTICSLSFVSCFSFPFLSCSLPFRRIGFHSQSFSLVPLIILIIFGCTDSNG